jgi:CRP/FNR family cyclic AMP-dependent transcriptional regulator
MPDREQAEPGLPPLGRRGIDLLAGVSLFEGLSRRQLKQIAQVAQESRYTRGASVVTAGGRGAAFFVIAEGRAKVVRSGRTLARLGPGEFFGELALLGGGRRSASVVAETPLTTIRLSRTAFRDVMSGEPQVAFRVMEVLVRRLTEATG